MFTTLRAHVSAAPLKQYEYRGGGNARDLSALTWVEFYRPQEFVDRGSEAAERALAEIKRVLTERRTVPRAADDELAAGPVHRHGTAP